MQTSHFRTVLVFRIVVTIFVVGYLSDAYNCVKMFETRTKTDPSISWARADSKISLSITNFPTFEGFNGTHLWSWPLADEQYYRLARLLPCRVLNYTIRGQRKKFAVIERFTWSGYGSVIHQLAWTFGIALAEDRIVVYRKPSNWVIISFTSMVRSNRFSVSSQLSTDGPLGNLDCAFLPISNCTPPASNANNQTIRLLADVQSIVARSFNPPSLDRHRPYVGMYVRRSDKVQFGEMSQIYTLEQ